jgi:16S rRNA (guanine(966)-N(2))-methyltransferase RsmD
MRIVGGRLRGRRLVGPTGSTVRPTSDRLRETLFNVLGQTLHAPRVLDACAGTGALGLEALSRGASHVTFIERDRLAIEDITTNVHACGAREACAIIRDDFLAARTARGTAGSWRGGRFDLVLIDPPYDEPDLVVVLEAAAAVAAPDARVVLEHRRRRDTPADVAGLTRQRVLEAGDSALSFYLAAPESA